MLADGEALEGLDEVQVDELAQGILEWAAKGIHIFLSSNNSQASFNKTISWWKNTRQVEETFRNALPDTYQKALAFLEVMKCMNCSSVILLVGMCYTGRGR